MMGKRIGLSICILCMSLLLTGCKVLDFLLEDRPQPGEPWQEPQETASIEGAREHLMIFYEKDISDITLLQQIYKEEYEKAISIDGATGLSRTVPARTWTCYKGYSPEEDIYFLIFHDTVRQCYDATSGEQRSKKFTEIMQWAEEFFGEDFIRTDVDLYMPKNFPLYNARALIPVYDSPDADIREAYNHLYNDIEQPFDSEYIYFGENGVHIKPEPYLNVYVNCSLSQLDEKYEGLLEEYRSFNNVLIYVTDGVYNRPYIEIGKEDEIEASKQP